VQSTLPAAFDAQDVAALRLVGSHLGDALDGMQQVADLRDSLRQGEALRQIQDRIRDAPDQGAVLRGAEKALGEVLGVPVRVVPAAGSWAPQSPGGYPIEVNGALVAEFALGAGVRRSLTEEERAVVRAACGEVGEALERLQLLERTRARANRERVVREIVDKIEQSPDLEALMRVTAEELAHVLHAHAFVRMGTTDELLRR
jgi:predicted component of type VI protein secretion system